MNTEHLAYILEIHRCQSINQASKALFISQPSLSSLLKNIEAEIGYKIFERTNTGIRPTEQGEIFLQFAKRVWNEYTSVCHTGQPLRESDNLSISSACSSLYSRAFFEYKNAYAASGVTLDVLRESTIYGSLQDIIANRTRIAITYYGYKHTAKYEKYAHKNGLAHFPLADGLPVKVVVAGNHPLVRRAAPIFMNCINIPSSRTMMWIMKIRSAPLAYRTILKSYMYQAARHITTRSAPESIFPFQWISHPVKRSV